MVPVKFILTDEKNRTEITRNRWQSHPNSTAKKIETKLHVFNLDTFTIDLKKKWLNRLFCGRDIRCTKGKFN